MVKSNFTIAIEALRGIKKALKTLKVSKIKVSVHPNVASHIFNELRSELNLLENEYNAKIVIEADIKEHIENVRITKA